MEIANKLTLKITFVQLSLQRDRAPGLQVQSEQAEVQHLVTQARQSTPYTPFDSCATLFAKELTNEWA